MKYTANELKNLTANATTEETYIYKFNNGNIHTDNITYLGNGCFDDSEIDELPYDENGEIDVDVQIMDSEDYNRTVYANCCERFEDEYEEGDTVAVIVVRK